MKKQRILSVGLLAILPLLLITGLIGEQGTGPVGVSRADWEPIVSLNGLLVTFPGDFVSELGGTDWDPADTTTQASDANGDQVWIFRSTDIPSGTWTFKAAVGGTWDENYGAGGQPNGPSIAFTATAGVTVSLYYDRRDHYVTSRPDTRIPVIVGDFLSEMGGADWSPASLTGWLKDKDGDGVYTWLAHNVPGGRWSYKVALNESMAENYGAGGVPGGSSIVLNVPAGGADVLFEYNDNTHLVNAQVLVHDLGFAPAGVLGEMPNNVQAVAIGDLDHDGRLDVVSGDAGSKNIIAWRNDGTPFNGDWSYNVIGAAMGAVGGLALADLDRDGDLDAVSVDDAGYLILYQNDGTPFSGIWSTTQKIGSYPLYSIVTADLDKDGWIDLVTGGHVSYSYELLGWRNTGNPFNPGAWSASNFGQPSAVYALAAADIDYDGDMDLAAGGISQDITVWKNDGSPFDGVWAHNNAGSASKTIHALAFNDIDRDGDLDLVSASETDAGERAVQLWLNDRHDAGGDQNPFSGTWTKRDIGATSRFGYGVVMLDMDRDGDVDIIAALNAGEGNLSGWANDEYGTVWKAYSLDGSSQSLLALAAGDLDGDGDADLVGGSDAHKLLAWENLNLADEWGNWTAYPSPDTEKAFAGIAAGDFNGDSWTDIAAARPVGGIYLWRYDVISHWVELRSPLVLTNVVDVAIGQIMTGTGNENNQDLVAASDGHGLRAWFVSERGMVWDPASTGLPTSGKYKAIALGDVNRDGNLDIIAAGDGVRYYRNNGWSWAADTEITTTDTYSAVVVADINHDAYLDVMGAAKSGGILIWLGNGGTAWNRIGKIGGSDQFSALAVGDLNRDGNPDLAAASPEGCMLWLGDGTGNLTKGQAPECQSDMRAVALNDYDLDGDLDWIAAGLKGIYLYRQQADGSWVEASENLPQGPSNFRDILFTPIDHDGALDLIASEDASGIYAWTAREPPPAFSNFQPGYPQRWVTTRTPLCSVDVTDIGSGLDVERGAWYQYSTDNGSTWSAWHNATITGTNIVSGTHGPVQLWATPTLTESTSTQSRNKIRFRMYDMAGNLGLSPDYSVWVDTVPPSNPVQIYSTDHTEGAFSNDTSLTFHWSGGSDETSGVLGYYWVLTNSMTNTATPRLMGYAHVHDVTLYATGEGSWYLHLATQDFAGNWSAQARRGPYWIDTSPPTTPTLAWSSQATNTWSNRNVISATLNAHDYFGLAGYSFDWSQNSQGWVDEISDTTSNLVVSGPLSDGRWYLHTRAVDRAGNASEIAHFGPFGVDVTPPSGCSISTQSSPVNTSSFWVSWYCQDTSSGVSGYDVQVRQRITDTWTNWQTWQTLTTATYVHYTGAEHLRIYQFRARAHDVAGNVTGYFTSTETLVQLPPSIASYTPTRGFASAGRNAPPLQVVPGTMVAITGTAFAPTATVYFRGVAMEPTTSQVVNENLIHAVIGVGTPTGSGQMCVRTRFGQDCEPFEVVDQPFPVRWGLGFDNFNTSSDEMNWGIFERAFGKCEVNFCVIPNPFTGLPLPCEWCPSDDLLIPRWDADIFFRASRSIAENGDCYGISHLTMDFYKGVKSPDDFADGADIPASLSWETPELVNEIRARHWRQLSLEALLSELDAIVFYETFGPLAMLDSRMPYLQPAPSAVLCMQRGSHGHCIVPYDVNRELTTGTIYVYDNNYSYIANQDLALERVITVGATSWEYPDWGGTIWGNYYILLPYSIVGGPHHLPTDILGLNIIFGSSAGHSRVQDAEGRMIGYDETGQFTQTIPISDAMRIIPFMEGSLPFEGYYLPRPGDYTIHVSGTASGMYSMTLFGDGGTGLYLQDVSLEPTTRDVIDVGQHSATSESLFELTTSDTRKPITLTLLHQVNGGNGERSFALQDLALGSGSPLTLTTANGARSLIIGGGPGSDYDLCFYSVGAGLAPSEFCWSDIHLASGDRHILTPQDWEHLNATRVRLDIDHGNDGTIDETRWLEGHGLALSMLITPTVVRSGTLLTYTLGYTVTGSEAAPGAVLTATVPHSVTFLSATGGATPAGNVLTWSLGDLTPSATGQVTFTVQVHPVPDDVIIGNLAYLRDTSGRWAMVGGAAAGPEFGRRKIYLPLILKQ